MSAKIVFNQLSRRYYYTEGKNKGRFAKSSDFVKQNKRKVEVFLTEQLGRAPRGNNWVAIASQYPEKFGDFIQDL